MDKRDQMMWRYLLGELPEAERETLEKAYFSDRRLFERVVRVENELLDGYVRGMLAPETRERFERHYLAHPARRERAKFAEALAAKLEMSGGVGAAPTEGAESFLGRLRNALRAPGPAWALSIALLLLTAAGAAWYFAEVRRLRRELAMAEVERVTLERRGRELQQEVAEGRRRSEGLSGELERLRAEQQTNSSTPPPPPPEISRAFATVTLTVGGARGADAGAPARLVVPAGTEQVRLRLELRDLDYPSYRAVLQPPGGEEVYSWQRLAPRGDRGNSRLTLVMPARRLPAGDYVLTLRGVGRTGEVEDAGKLLLQVIKR